jgi:hypothetical protein
MLSRTVLPAYGLGYTQKQAITTPAGAKGVLVLVPVLNNATISGVTFGGLPLTRVVDVATSGLQSHVSAWFLGGGIPQGTWMLYVFGNATYPQVPSITFMGGGGDTAIEHYESSTGSGAALTAQAFTAIEASTIFHSVADPGPGATTDFAVVGATVNDLLQYFGGAGVLGVSRLVASGPGAQSVGYTSPSTGSWSQLAVAVKQAPAPVTPPALTYKEMILRRTGVLSYNPFDEAANPVLDSYRRSSGSDAPGDFNASGSLTYRVAGPKGSDYAIDLTGDATLNKPMGSDFQMTDTFGGELWFKRNRFTGSGDAAPGNGEEWLVMNWSGSGTPTGKWLLAIDYASGRIYFRDPMGNTVAHTSTAVNDKNWHHLAWGKNGGSNVIFIDGVEDSIDDSPSFAFVANDTIRFGGDWTPRNYYGKIAKFAFYSRMPTQAEVNESRAMATG